MFASWLEGEFQGSSKTRGLKVEMVTLIVVFIFANFTKHEVIFSTPRARALECHQVKLSILISNVLLLGFFSRSIMALLQNKKGQEKVINA